MLNLKELEELREEKQRREKFDKEISPAVEYCDLIDEFFDRLCNLYQKGGKRDESKN